jgi:hypothetical protein
VFFILLVVLFTCFPRIGTIIQVGVAIHIDVVIPTSYCYFPCMLLLLSPHMQMLFSLCVAATLLAYCFHHV